MRLRVCVLMLLLGVALSWAGPAPKAAQKKSLEDSKLESKKQELNIEETGEDKDRAKKSTASFCVEIKPGSSQAMQVPCKAAQTAASNTVLTIPSEPATQTIQTFNIPQPSYAQSVSQSNLLVPQQVLQPSQSFQLVQSSSQPCFEQSPSVSIVQPVSQTNVVHKTSEPMVKPNPKPIQTATEQPKPEPIKEFPLPLPVPQETLTVLPVHSSYQEPVITVPSQPSQLSNFVSIPSVSPCNNPLHGLLTPCTCQNNMAMLSESSMEPMAIKVLSPLSYSSPYARSSSPIVLQYDPNMLSNILDHHHMGKARHHHLKTHTHVDVNADLPYIQYQPQPIYQKPISVGVETIPVNPYPTKNVVMDNVHASSGITINAYPHLLRAANPMMEFGSLRNKETVENSPLMSDTNDFMQSNKMPREISLKEFSPVKTEETKLQEDERRDIKSSKDIAN